MAITNVPKIYGPDFGGVIYGLDLSVGYSSEPSTLMVYVVNENGVYNPPALNSHVSISFGSFKFYGIIWSYSIEETSQEKILKIEIKDHSVILDRYYVLLWKRGMFREMGNRAIVEKTINLSHIQTVIPKRKSFLEFEFEEVNLEDQKIYRSISYLNKVFGSIICLGEEEIPNTPCDIPNTSYTLNNLKSLIGGIAPGWNITAPYGFKNTHEGRLREVLQNWSADCGYDFYWDFSSNKIRTYQVEGGIELNIPRNIQTPNILEKKYSKSLEGTFRQYALAYTAYPKESIKTVNQSVNLSYALGINPFPVSWFLKNNNTLQEIKVSTQEDGPEDDDPDKSEKDLWGGRTEEEFLQAAFLGYISEALRDYYLFKEKFFWPLGITIQNALDNKEGNLALTNDQKTQVLEYLSTIVPDDLNLMQKIDEEGLPNYTLWFATKNDDLNAKWKKIEQDILLSYGSVYRHNIKGGTAYYCNPDSFATTEITVSPSPNNEEPYSKDFERRPIFQRSGRMSHDQNQAIHLLELDSDANAAQFDKIKPFELDIINTGLINIFPNTEAKVLFFVPNEKLIKKILKQFEVIISTGSNKMEPTISDSVKNTEDTFKCDPFDQTIKQGTCLSAEDEAKQMALKKLSQDTEQNDEGNLTEGLKNRKAKTAKIKLFNKTLTIAAPSFAQYQVVCNFSHQIEFVSSNQNNQVIFFNGSYGGANDVAQIDVINDNVTSTDDSFSQQRKTSIPLARSVSNTRPQETITYTFAGEPPAGLSLSPVNGLSKLDITYSSEGYKSTATYNTRPPQRTALNTFLRKMQSQLNRRSFNAN